MLAEPRAVLWDFDGTLVDTEPLWMSTEQQMLGEHGLSFSPEKMEAMRGQSAWITARMLAEACGLPGAQQHFYDDLHARIAQHILSNDLPWLPGARELMAELDALGIACAIVTASNRQVIDAAFQRLPSNVELIVTSDDVTHTKPHPEPYLTAAQRLGVDPGHTVALEDSVPGTASALAAGSVVYAVPAEAILAPHPRMRIVEGGLEGTTWADLVETWHRHRHHPHQPHPEHRPDDREDRA